MTTKRSLMRRATAVAATATAALVLAACGGNGDDTGSAQNGNSPAAPSASASAPAQRGENNAADVAFAQGMIPHHRQAVAMADLAATRAEAAEVKKLAAEIKKAQDPEIKTLSGWLTSWGEQVPAEGEGHDGHDMSGMMSAQEMKQLESSSGKAFDTAFLQMMVEHHEGAVAMAKTEQSDGKYGPAKDMAGAIITSQSAEIAQMNTLLGNKS